jgi:hypothetical protein
LSFLQEKKQETFSKNKAKEAYYIPQKVKKGFFPSLKEALIGRKQVKKRKKHLSLSYIVLLGYFLALYVKPTTICNSKTKKRCSLQLHLLCYYVLFVRIKN